MRDARSDHGFMGTTLAAAVGFTAGLMAGVVVGEWLGDVNAKRLRTAVQRLGAGGPPPTDPVMLERLVLRGLRDDPHTRHLPIQVRVVDSGLVELTGRVPTEDLRERAGEAARTAAGDDAVINRLLVEGSDVPREAQ